MSVAPSPLYRPKRRLLTHVVIVLSVALLLFATWLLFVNSASHQLAELRAQGMPVSVPDLETFYAVPAGVTDTTNLWVAAIKAVEAANISERGRDLPIVGENLGRMPSPGKPWAELKPAQDFLRSLDLELQMIWKAAEANGKPRFPTVFLPVLSSPTRRSHDVIRLLVLHAMTSAHQEAGDAVLRDLLSIFALSAAICGEPTLTSQLLGHDCFNEGCSLVVVLSPYCHWKDDQLEQLQAAVDSVDFRTELTKGLIGERAIALSEISQLPLGPLLQGPARSRALPAWQEPIDELSGDWATAIARRMARPVQTDVPPRFLGENVGVPKSLFPAAETAVYQSAHCVARSRVLNVVLGCARYRLMHSRLPETLDEIDPEFLIPSVKSPNRLIDPFGGERLRFRVEKSEVIIYSVGGDLRDDGGLIRDDKTVLGRDLGFSMSR